MVLEHTFGFSYTRKDLILYALSLGLGSPSSSSPQRQDDDADADLRFLYERHPHFTSLPIFCLTFVFWSNRQQQKNQQYREGCRSDRIPPFPPPLMSQEQVIPAQFLLDSSIDLSTYPVIHTWESIKWEQSTPVPPQNNNNNNEDNNKVVDIVIDLETISVQPKSIGTFVTSQSTVRRVLHNGDNKNHYNNNSSSLSSSSSSSSILCTIQSTVVVFGIPKEAVSPWESGVPRQQTFHPPSATARVVLEETPPTLEWTYTPARNQALLYRIASGDTNHIHVDTSVSEQMGNTGTSPTAPLLHGLFTLGVAFRGILKICPDADQRIRQLEAKFTQPCFVGDTLMVRLWKVKSCSTTTMDTDTDTTTTILFQVLNKGTGVVLVDGGCATFLGWDSDEDGKHIPATARDDGGPRRTQQSRL